MYLKIVVSFFVLLIFSIAAFSQVNKGASYSVVKEKNMIRIEHKMNKYYKRITRKTSKTYRKLNRWQKKIDRLLKEMEANTAKPTVSVAYYKMLYKCDPDFK